MAVATLAASFAVPGTAQAVIGGTPASRDYGFMAAMLVEGNLSCGGSLVAPQYVLTAAHCWDSAKPEDVELVIGGVSLRLEEGQRIRPASVEVHEYWPAPPAGAEARSYDVALVRLSEPASATPIPLADPVTEKSLWLAQAGFTAPRKPARVIGYGQPSVDPPGALFETDVSMVADKDCKDSYDLTIGGFESTTMVCAGEPYGLKDSCAGDSGGPLMVSRTGNLSSGVLVQVGVVSWGFHCGVPTQPGVYSRVGDDPLHHWIRRRIGGASMSPGEDGGKAVTITDDDAPASAGAGVGGVLGVQHGGRCAKKRRGTNRSEKIVGTRLGDLLLGLAGNDALSGLSGDDCLVGGKGKDRLAGASGKDRLVGGSGSDRLSGGSGTDRLAGGSGSDRLVGGSGSDRLSGGPGRDSLSGGRGKNRYLGGSGNDTVNAANGVREIVSCGAGRDRARVDRSDRVRACERVRR